MELKWTSKALSDLARLYEFLAPMNKPSTILLTNPHIGEQLFQLEPREVRRTSYRWLVDQIANDMGDLKHRMSGLDQAMILVKRGINLSEETDARQQITLNKLAERIGRIERRLELS
nr:hypothetical protein [Acidithiobacillus albertensis]